MIWLTDHITEHLSVLNDHGYVQHVVSAYHRVCNWSNATDATSGAGTADLSGAQCFVVRCLSFCPGFFFCLSFFDLRILITRLVSSNYSSEN
jgi:hypothetical protein